MPANANMSPLITILRPLKPSELPPEELIIAQGKTLIEESVSWKPGKKHWEVVNTSYRPKLIGDGAPFHCRISEHTPDQISFDVLWDKLSRNKAENEMGFNPEIQKVTLLKQLSSSASIWSMYYKFPSPVSSRVFSELQVVKLFDENPRTGIIVSIPIDLTSDGDLIALEEKGVKAKYASVERVLELESGNVEWRCASSGTAGGNIPDWLVEPTLEKTIAQEVPLFFKWFNALENSNA